MSIKQRTRAMPTSSFLEKFKGKTSVVGKDGLSGLFNRLQLKASSSNSLHESASQHHYNKQNMETANTAATKYRKKRLDAYTQDPIEKQKRNLRLPKIKTSMIAASEDSRYTQESNKWKAYSQYQHKGQETTQALDKFYIDNYAAEFQLGGFHTRKMTLQK